MVGARIKKLRKSKRLTQKEFACLLGISANYLSEIESGKKLPSKTILLLIEIRYAINQKWLLKGDGPMYAESVCDSGDGDFITRQIIDMLRSMETDKKMDVLKYAEEKNFLSELMKKYRPKSGR